MALVEAKNNDLITLTQFKECLYYLEGFHFSYNALAARPTNRLESIYSRFSINLRNCSDKVKAREIIKNLIADLDKIYISYTEFEEKFIQLSFTKSVDDSNMKAKYVINKIASHYENSELLESLIEEIDEKRAELKKINDKIAVLQKAKECPCCQTKNPQTAFYCQKCGSKLPTPADSSDDDSCDGGCACGCDCDCHAENIDSEE